MTTRTTTETLQNLVGRLTAEEKGGFLLAINGWGDDETKFKGRNLWIGVVERVLRGQPAVRDDTTVYSSLTLE
jgi:hypothetical protein